MPSVAALLENDSDVPVTDRMTKEEIDEFFRVKVEIDTAPQATR